MKIYTVWHFFWEYGSLHCELWEALERTGLNGWIGFSLVVLPVWFIPMLPNKIFLPHFHIGLLHENSSRPFLCANCLLIYSFINLTPDSLMVSWLLLCIEWNFSSCYFRPPGYLLVSLVLRSALSGGLLDQLAEESLLSHCLSSLPSKWHTYISWIKHESVNMITLLCSHELFIFSSIYFLLW